MTMSDNRFSDNGSSDERKVVDITRSICPQCHEIVDAKVIIEQGKVFLEKYCLIHGFGKALVSSDPEYYFSAPKYLRPGKRQKSYASTVGRGCPDDCGLCPDHEQHICMPVIEITGSCDMNCPICIAAESHRQDLTLEEIRKMVEKLIETEGKIDLLNISGGEPTVHPDYIEIVKYLSSVPQIVKVSVSTNGLNLLKRPELLKLHKSLGVIVSLQLDGEGGQSDVRLRGRDLVREKREIVSRLIEDDIDSSLIMTIGRGINDTFSDVGFVYDVFMKNDNFMSLLFQPLVYTHSSGMGFNITDRITIPDVIDLVAQVSSGLVDKDDFMPLPCCHTNCFALAHLLRVTGSGHIPLKRFLRQDRYIDLTKNRTLFGSDEDNFNEIRDMIFDFWVDSGDICDCMKDMTERAMKSIKEMIKEVQIEGYDARRAFSTAGRRFKSIYIHHFMDNDTFELTRVRKCCTVYPKPDGKFYPMCVYNNLIRGRNRIQSGEGESI